MKQSGDSSTREPIIFGPVPSRRLGRSLGINNVPYKSCSYSCVYCQIGPTSIPRIERTVFYGPDAILRAVEKRLGELKKTGEKIDYLTFVPDGEPTLDADLGAGIRLLKEKTGLPVAVITNASLLWKDDVREDLFAADLVSIKVDAVEEKAWRKINRPHSDLELGKVMEGMIGFAKEYKGKLITETMMLSGFGDDAARTKKIAAFIGRLRPAVAYIAVPTRPPAEKEVRPADSRFLGEAYGIFSEKIGHVEFLTDFEGDEFSSGGDLEKDLLSIASVHPLREDVVAALIKKSGGDQKIVRGLVDKGDLVEARYGGHKFFLRGAGKKTDGKNHN